MSKGKGVHAGADGPAVVFGKKNLDYVPQAASKEGSVQGSVESAVSDFSSHEETVEYPPLEYPKAFIDSDPDVEYLLEDEDFIRDMGLEGEENPEIDYSNHYVQDVIENEYNYMKHSVSETVSEWMDNLDIDDNEKQVVLIEGSDMGWRHQSGWKFVDADEFLEDPVNNVRPNTSEFRQEWTNDNGELTATQSHHDAQGEKYTFKVITWEEAEEDERYQIQRANGL